MANDEVRDANKVEGRIKQLVSKSIFLVRVLVSSEEFTFA